MQPGDQARLVTNSIAASCSVAATRRKGAELLALRSEISIQFGASQMAE
jgi:hypothetical protein